MNSLIETNGHFNGSFDLATAKPKEWWEPAIGERPTADVPQWAHGMVMMMLFVQASCGTFFNLGVLLLFGKRKDFASPTNTIVQSLAVSDLFMCSVGVATPMMASYHQTWPFGELGCAYDGFVHYLGGNVQIFTLVLVAVDRYICITRPMSPIKLNQAKAKMCVGGVWAMAFVVAFLPLLGWSKYVPEGPMTTCSVDWFSRDPGDQSYIIMIFIVCFVAPMGIIMFCYYFVYATIRNVARNGVWDVNSEKGKKNLAAEKKMLKTSVALLVSFNVCWVPYVLVAFGNAFGDPNSIPMFLQCFTPIFAKTQATLDPILYVGTNKRFREAFLEMLPCKCMAEDDDDDDKKGNKVAPAEQTQVTEQTEGGN
uniref:Xenopsin n=1 Tax=Spadella cephaloptera TaxID=52888 RepID=A0A7G9IS10_9BILA|nr:xenopsin [Spadella cephaloptera]